MKIPLKLAQALVNGGIDQDMLGFSGVAVMTVGELKGHGMKATAKTLETLLEAVKDTTVRAYLTHNDGDADRLGREIGVFRNFRIDGDALRADFRFLKAWTESATATYKKLLEMAETDPSLFGLSIVAYGKKTKARELLVESVASIDFVTQPAGNAALFETQQKEEKKMEIKAILEAYSQHGDAIVNRLIRFATDNAEADETAIKAEFQKIDLEAKQEKITALEADLTAKQDEIKQLTEKVATTEKEAAGLKVRLEKATKGADPGPRGEGEQSQKTVLEKYNELKGNERYEFYKQNRDAILKAQANQ